MTKEPNIKIEIVDAIVHITPLQPLTDNVILEFEKAFEVAKGHIVLDFKSVDYIYSKSVGSLVKCFKLQKEKNKQVVIINALDSLKNVLRAINLTDIIPIFDSFDDFLGWREKVSQTSHSTPPVSVKVENMDNMSIVKISGTVVGINTLNFKQNFEQAFDSVSASQVIINLSKVISLDSKAISSLIRFAQKMKEKDGRVVLAGCNDIIVELFQILSIESMFGFAKDEDDAMGILEVGK